jgi:hypothetical protein
MLEKIDEWVLWLTGQFVKKFNWLTGKDNFFLARVCCIGASFFFWVAVIIDNQSILVIPALYMFPFMFWGVRLVEKISEEERMAGIKKKYGDFLTEQSLRLLNLLANIFIFIIFIFLPHVESFMLGQSLVTAMLYLISVDKPPYSRSRAWELLKGWFKAILSPLPALNPVPVPVAPGNN